MNTFIKLLLAYVIIVIIDNLYIYFNKSMYEKIIDPTEQINFIYALLTWIVIIISIELLVLSRPDINSNNSFVYGAYLGFAMYALWNTTNFAIYPSKWNNNILIVDTLWGTTLTGTMSYIMYNYL